MQEVPRPAPRPWSSLDNRAGTGNLPGSCGRIPKRPAYPAGGMYGLVGVEVVQEGEEGTIGPPPAQPVEEGVVDPARVAGLEADPLLVVEVAATEDVLEDPAPRDRAAQEGSRRQRIILEMGEAPIQPGLVSAAVACSPTNPAV